MQSLEDKAGNGGKINKFNLVDSWDQWSAIN